MIYHSNKYTKNRPCANRNITTYPNKIKIKKGDCKMKTLNDFIYLDDSYLTSYMSQINNGIINTKISNLLNETNSMTENIPETTEYSKNSEGEGSIALIKGKINVSERIIPAGIRTYFLENETVKETLIKQIHDDAFKGLLEYLNDNNLLCSINNLTFDKYLKTTDNIKIYDIDYLTAIFNNNFANLLADDEINKIGGITKTKSDTRNKIKNNKKNEINIFNDALNLLKNFLPTNVIFIHPKFIIPINPKYLRENSKSILFKYDNQKLSILGKVTKKIELNPNDNNIFSMMLNSVVSEFFKVLTVDIKDKYILSPIAIYC